MTQTSRGLGRAIGWGSVIVALAVLHQDLWLWDDRRLLFGFIPIGLAYHAGFSIAAACLWALMVKFAWPSELERWADQGSGGGSGGASGVASAGERDAS